jgi:hypothetical protein
MFTPISSEEIVKTKISIVVAFLSISELALGQNSTAGLRHEIVSHRSDATAPAVFSIENVASPAKKNQALAVVYSLLVPGTGELYADRFDNGRYSLVAEAALWLTYASFQQYGNWLQGDARSFASAHAGATPSGKDDQFYVNLGNFSNMYDYNDKKLHDRNISEIYDPSQGYFWNWDSDRSRQRFRSLRISSDKVLNNSRFVIGAIVVNHILSALNAARLVRQFNKNADEAFGTWQLEPNVIGGLGQVDGIRLTYDYKF